jgi:hypothetical protein
MLTLCLVWLRMTHNIAFIFSFNKLDSDQGAQGTLLYEPTMRIMSWKVREKVDSIIMIAQY